MLATVAVPQVLIDIHIALIAMIAPGRATEVRLAASGALGDKIVMPIVSAAERSAAGLSLAAKVALRGTMDVLIPEISPGRAP
jgi:hypothetical protein